MMHLSLSHPLSLSLSLSLHIYIYIMCLSTKFARSWCPRSFQVPAPGRGGGAVSGRDQSVWGCLVLRGAFLDSFYTIWGPATGDPLIWGFRLLFLLWYFNGCRSALSQLARLFRPAGAAEVAAIPGRAAKERERDNIRVLLGNKSKSGFVCRFCGEGAGSARIMMHIVEPWF